MPARLVRHSGLILAVLLAALLWLGLQVACQNLGPAAASLLGAYLHLAPGQVRVSRAALHPLGELRLSGVRVSLGGDLYSAGQATIYFDPLGALSGRPRMRWVSASSITANLGPLGPVHAEGATLLREEHGRYRVQVHGLSSLGNLGPLTVEHLGLELQGRAPQRLAATGVRLGQVGPVELWAQREAGGLRFRGAAKGGLVVGGVSPGEFETDLEMTRLPLPLGLTPLFDLSKTLASGQFHLDAQAGPAPSPALPGGLRLPGVLTARGQLLLTDVTMNAPFLAPVALPDVTLLLDGELSVSRQAAPDEVVISTPRLSLGLGEARLSLSGDLHLAERYRAGLELVLDEIDCARLLQSLPQKLLPNLEGLGVSGQIGGVIRLVLDSEELPELSLTSETSIGCQVLGDSPRADPHVVLDPHLSIERPGEDGRPRRLPLGALAPGADGAPGFQPLAQLDWPIVRAFLVAEDNLFFQHHGFDPQMIGRALGLDLKDQQTMRGASTITQQLAKNLWLGQERALGRKLEEAVLTWRLEQVVPKERILEVYLNLVELGSGIYGLSMAAQHYFGLPPGRLSLDQATQLAALLPAPRRGMDTAWSRRYHELSRRLPKASIAQRPSSASATPR